MLHHQLHNSSFQVIVMLGRGDEMFIFSYLLEVATSLNLRLYSSGWTNSILHLGQWIQQCWKWFGVSCMDSAAMLNMRCFQATLDGYQTFWDSQDQCDHSMWHLLWNRCWTKFALEVWGRIIGLQHWSWSSGYNQGHQWSGIHSVGTSEHVPLVLVYSFCFKGYAQSSFIQWFNVFNT